MKKKVLTTAAALAMLAPTMTSFAATPNKVVTGSQNTSPTSDLKITGQVNNSSGQAPEGQISVTLPTAVSFVVDQDGVFTAADTMSIENNSQNVDITVSVSSFSDTTSMAGQGITVISESEFNDSSKSYDRSYVALTLTATGGTSASNVELLSSGFTAQKLVDLDAGDTTGLTLNGQAGDSDYNSAQTGEKNEQDIDQKGAQDSFTLQFKISKR